CARPMLYDYSWFAFW
nr:immunoglobulin heavy chain junction region [Mus musculus]